MERDDHTLLFAMRRGDHAAAAALWSRHASRLIAYAGSIVGRTDAEDAVQEAMIRAIATEHAALAGVRDVPAWLATLVRRAALNRLRETRRRRVREVGAAPLRPAVRSALDTDSVAAQVASLPRRLREVIVLRHVCGLTFAQCAVTLGANANTVASRYRDAIDELRAGLACRETSSGPAHSQAASRVEVVHG